MRLGQKVVALESHNASQIRDLLIGLENLTNTIPSPSKTVSVEGRLFRNKTITVSNEGFFEAIGNFIKKVVDGIISFFSKLFGSSKNESTKVEKMKKEIEKVKKEIAEKGIEEFSKDNQAVVIEAGLRELEMLLDTSRNKAERKKYLYKNGEPNILFGIDVLEDRIKFSNKLFNLLEETADITKDYLKSLQEDKDDKMLDKITRNNEELKNLFSQIGKITEGDGEMDYVIEYTELNGNTAYYHMVTETFTTSRGTDFTYKSLSKDVERTKSETEKRDGGKIELYGKSYEDLLNDQEVVSLVKPLVDELTRDSEKILDKLSRVLDFYKETVGKREHRNIEYKLRELKNRTDDLSFTDSEKSVYLKILKKIVTNIANIASVSSNFQLHAFEGLEIMENCCRKFFKRVALNNKYDEEDRLEDERIKASLSAPILIN